MEYTQIEMDLTVDGDRIYIHPKKQIPYMTLHRLLMLNNDNTDIDIAIRFVKLWNAAEGMSNEDAVKALENHAKMVAVMKMFIDHDHEKVGFMATIEGAMKRILIDLAVI